MNFHGGNLSVTDPSDFPRGRREEKEEEEDEEEGGEGEERKK